MSPEVIKEDGQLYGNQGAELVAMGDQVMQEEGGSMGGGSSWEQFPGGGFCWKLHVHVHMFIYTCVCMCC